MEFIISIIMLLLCVAGCVWAYWRERPLSLVRLPTLSKTGAECECSGAFVTLATTKTVNKEWFRSGTVILGYGPQRERGAATAIFNFDVPKSYRATTVEAKLRIEADRVHGGLHTSQAGRKASIYINDDQADTLYCVAQMPGGQDYGFGKIGPIRVENRLKNAEVIKVKLAIEAEMAWDLDRVELEFTESKRQLTTCGSMVFGAFLSAGVGALISVIAFWPKS